MRNLIIIAIVIFSLTSCKSKKSVDDSENLPKDIALKPENNLSQQQDREQLSAMIKQIDSLTQSEICADPADWAFTAIGSKPCGGPSSYIAYPKKLATEILPKVERFTTMQTAFNKKYQMISDCAIVMPPAGIKCEEGKAILMGESSSESEVR